MYLNPFKQVMYHLFVASKGGQTRAQIIHCLFSKPRNANQISKVLDLDYKTVTHHLKILVQNKMLEFVDKKYGSSYFISEMLEEHKTIFEEIWDKFGK